MTHLGAHPKQHVVVVVTAGGRPRHLGGGGGARARRHGGSAGASGLGWALVGEVEAMTATAAPPPSGLTLPGSSSPSPQRPPSDVHSHLVYALADGVGRGEVEGRAGHRQVLACSTAAMRAARGACMGARAWGR